MHYLEVTPVIDLKHGVEDLDEIVQKVDIPHTVRSSYINSSAYRQGCRIEVYRVKCKKGEEITPCDGQWFISCW